MNIINCLPSTFPLPSPIVAKLHTLDRLFFNLWFPNDLVSSVKCILLSSNALVYHSSLTLPSCFVRVFPQTQPKCDLFCSPRWNNQHFPNIFLYRTLFHWLFMVALIWWLFEGHILSEKVWNLLLVLILGW